MSAAGTISLAQFLIDTGLLVSFTDEVVLLEAGLILRPDREKHLFSPEAIEVFDCGETAAALAGAAAWLTFGQDSVDHDADQLFGKVRRYRPARQDYTHLDGGE